MRVRLLGAVAAAPDDGPLVEPPGPVPAAVLAHLALADGRVLTPEALGDVVWDAQPDNVRNALQAAVSRLRRTYGAALVETSHGGYRLGPADVDASRARALLDEVRAGDLAAGAQALGLWQGEPLAGLTSSASDVARRSLVELRLELLTAYADALSRRGRPREAIPVLREAATAAPYDELVHARLMRSLAASGRAGDALTVYDDLRHRLADDLGIDPSPETSSTFAAILDGAERDEPSTGVSEPRTRTVLLTDVVGSARLWTERPEAVTDALLAHHALVSELVAQHDGLLPPDQGEGDARLAVFVSSVDAISCAHDLQHRLEGLAWPHGLRLHVRAALARGEVVEVDGNVFGAVVPLCARLRTLAHGDQVLLTSGVAADLPADGSQVLRPLGRVPLRDFDEVEVLQLDDPRSPRDFPSLRTSLRLPTARTSVVGRQRELEELRGAVLEHRLVTVTGLGGCGKTTLALETARVLAPDFPDATVFVDLSACTTGADAVERLGASLVGDGSSRTVDALRALGPRTLLVLDNLEQLPDADELVGQVLRESPATVLATSRAPLVVDGEVVRPLGPLDPRDALALLESRAAELDPEGTRDPQALARIVRTVGGVPLALELAAGRLRVLDAEQLADVLDERLALLSSARGVPERQRALEELLADTWRATDPRTRLVLSALAVARAPMSVPAIADLAGLPTVETADALDDVVSRGLARIASVPGASRSVTLLELVRRHALDAVGPDLLDRLRRRLAEQVAAAVARDRAATVRERGDDIAEALRCVRQAPDQYDDDTRTALARAALDLARWDDLASVLDGVPGPEAANLLGVALVRSTDADDVERGRALLRRCAEQGDADAAAVLGGSLREVDPTASYGWYRRALDLDPSDAYALGNVLEHELLGARDDGPLTSRADALRAARDRRRAQVLVGEDLPWSAYDAGRFGAWLGDPDALHLLVEGVAASTSARQVDTTLASFRRLARDDEQWNLAARVLEVALLRRTSTPTSSRRVLVLAGASAASAHEAVMRWAAPLTEVLRGTDVEILSGGTDRGVSALAADVARAAGLRSVGWLPLRLPGDVAASTGYTELRRTDGEGFSLREPLAYWTDLLARGGDPALVHLLALGGGELTSLELHLAQALGARVAVGAVDGSTSGAGLLRAPVRLTGEPSVLRGWLRR